MQLASKAKKFFYTSFLILLLAKLGDVTQTQLGYYWQNSKPTLSKLFRFWQSHQPARLSDHQIAARLHGTQPLVMTGGDPYVRALMRTITASEANVSHPYNVIYGGKMIDDLSTHPELCVAIVAGPNIGNCTTAAGRYQMLDFTWSRQAKKYHPNPSGIWRWRTYSFEAEYQDIVVHDWLSDSQAWGVDIPQLLRQGEIGKVLRLLSGTWTSLGYGIETNSMSSYLPQIYHNMLKEELS